MRLLARADWGKGTQLQMPVGQMIRITISPFGLFSCFLTVKVKSVFDLIEQRFIDDNLRTMFDNICQ